MSNVKEPRFVETATGPDSVKPKCAIDLLVDSHRNQTFAINVYHSETRDPVPQPKSSPHHDLKIVERTQGEHQLGTPFTGRSILHQFQCTLLLHFHRLRLCKMHLEYSLLSHEVEPFFLSVL